jgi:hypothetical protein
MPFGQDGGHESLHGFLAGPVRWLALREQASSSEHILLDQRRPLSGLQPGYLKVAIRVAHKPPGRTMYSLVYQ